VIDSEHPSIPLVESMIANAQPAAGTVKTAPVAKDTTPAETPPAKDESDLSQSTTSPQPVATSLPKKPSQVSSNRTPSSVAREREQFDRRYLQRGLDAYYRGDYDEAAALLQPLADKGVSRAQFRIGYMYYLGRGFERDRAKADQIIRAALPAVQKFADEGRGWAQSDIGSLYEDGLVLPRDYGEAIYWYRSAAEQGYPGAQTNLGVMYARGLGVSASRKTAVEWFQRAAKQGDIAAIRNLEAMGISP
jgi:TPR repeat protein